MGFTFGVASKVKRLFFSQPIKEKGPEDCRIVNPGLGSGITDFGSKDETFFDSRVWLDSDCEDDYYSVNGDFTPRGNTPNRQFGTNGTPQRNDIALYADLFPNNRSEPSPTDKKKLAELLQVSFGEQESNEPNSTINFDGIAKPDNEINAKIDIEDSEVNPPQSSSEGTPKPKKERSGLTATCCIPGLVPSISSRKHKMSPTN